MKKLTEHQIVSMLKKAEAGIPVKELCRKYGMENSTFRKWRDKFGGMETSDI
jgi:putative transposase